MTTTTERRVALITGAAVGLGQAFAARLAADGLDVVVADVNDGEETLELVQRAGGRGLAVRCDITDEEQVASLAVNVERTFGAVDVLVNNAGIFPKGDLARITLAEWRRVFAVNVEGAFLVTREFLPPMRQREWGRVVFMASTSFHAGAPGFPHYVATKGALIGLTHALATEVGGDGVTVNALAPSIVLTHGTKRVAEEAEFAFTRGRQAIRRTEQPQDVVGALSFVVSDDAAFMTGQTLVIDGGLIRS
jgi:NAD(P)-dependent dehydrogenase (short-subunit alcohol dehydrogenase family)